MKFKDKGRNIWAIQRREANCRLGRQCGAGLTQLHSHTFEMRSPWNSTSKLWRKESNIRCQDLVSVGKQQAAFRKWRNSGSLMLRSPSWKRKEGQKQQRNSLNINSNKRHIKTNISVFIVAVIFFKSMLVWLKLVNYRNNTRSFFELFFSKTK